MIDTDDIETTVEPAGEDEPHDYQSKVSDGVYAAMYKVERIDATTVEVTVYRCYDGERKTVTPVPERFDVDTDTVTEDYALQLAEDIGDAAAALRGARRHFQNEL